MSEGETLPDRREIQRIVEKVDHRELVDQEYEESTKNLLEFLQLAAGRCLEGVSSPPELVAGLQELVDLDRSKIQRVLVLQGEPVTDEEGRALEVAFPLAPSGEGSIPGMFDFTISDAEFDGMLDQALDQILPDSGPVLPRVALMITEEVRDPELVRYAGSYNVGWNDRAAVIWEM